MKSQAMREIEELSAPLIKWINDNRTPHTKIIVGCDFAEVVSAEMRVINESFIKD